MKIMSEGQSEVACPKCGCAAWSWANQDEWGQACMTCGNWHEAKWGGEENEGGGFGVAAYAKDEKGYCWFPLKEPTQQPFTPEMLTEMDWAWFARPVGDGRWEGLAVKGSPDESWPIGIIPKFRS